ncbi:3890_t:CDS:1, partial [Paraglomus occultum]
REKEIYDKIKKEIRKKVKARELLKEELTENDEKIKDLEKRLEISKKEIKELEKLLVPCVDDLTQKLEIKKEELKRLVNDAKEEIEKNNLNYLEEDLVHLLESQSELVKSDNNSSQEELAHTKETINRYFKNTKKIEEICQKQAEITELKVGLNKLKMKNVKNILLIGNTGSGKSTLANVLTDTSEFKEGKYATSETKETQIREFEEKYAVYRVIDTVGIGDTQLSEDNVLDKIIQTIYYLREGISQIVFVTSDRFDDGEIMAYKLAKTIFASGSEDIDDYITIVRTRFTDFENQEECRKDIDLMIKNGGKLSEIIKKVKEKGKIIHVNNGTEQERNFSRSILVNYLVENCRKVYNESLDLRRLSKAISINMSKIEGLERRKKEEIGVEDIRILENEIAELRKELRQSTKEHID